MHILGKTFCFLFFVHISIFACSQEIQFADSLIGYSTQFSTKKFSAREILGRPSMLGSGNFQGNTWCAAENVRDAFIHVGFKTKTKIRQIAIFEFALANTISAVYAYDQYGKSHQVYKGNPKNIHIEKRTLHIQIPLTSYDVYSLRIECNFSQFPANSRCHLDAVAITDSEIPVEASIHLPPKSIIAGEPERLGSNINSHCDELLPLISSDGKFMMFVRNGCETNMEGNTSTGDEYYSEYVNGAWTKSQNMGPVINNTGNNAVASISPDGNSVLLFGKYSKGTAAFDLTGGLSVSHRTTNGWSFPENITIRNFYTQSAVNNYFMAADWKTLILCIERRDSRGEADLYVSFWEGENNWSEPKHMGSQVNSASLEFSPFLAPDGVTLYFASWGLPGYGMADMFVSKRLDDTWQHWSEPVNMGPGINTTEFDSYYKITADGTHGYYVSSKNSLGAGDIFAMQLPEALKPEAVVLVKGKVLNAKTKVPLPAGIKYEVLSSGKEIGETVSNPLTGYYSIVLPYGKNYGYRAIADGYISVNENLDLLSVSDYREIIQDIYLVPLETGQTIKLNNIFFIRSQPLLLPESFPELDRLVQLMKENNTLEIEVHGHTDNVGNADLNQTLSEKRVDAVKQYVISKGIEKKRITGKGFGGSKPVAPNDTEENKKKNRRVEFMVFKN